MQEHCLSDAIFKAFHARTSRTMSATVERAGCFDAMPDNTTPAVRTCWSERVDGAFQTVKRVCAPGAHHLERLVVIVAADFADCHHPPPQAVAKATVMPNGPAARAWGAERRGAARRPRVERSRAPRSP